MNFQTKNFQESEVFLRFFNFLESWNFRKVCGNKLKFLDWTWTRIKWVGIIFFGIHLKDYELWNSCRQFTHYSVLLVTKQYLVNDLIRPWMTDKRLILFTSKIFYLIVLSNNHNLTFLTGVILRHDLIWPFDDPNLTFDNVIIWVFIIFYDFLEVRLIFLESKRVKVQWVPSTQLLCNIYNRNNSYF